MYIFIANIDGNVNFNLIFLRLLFQARFFIFFRFFQITFSNQIFFSHSKSDFFRNLLFLGYWLKAGDEHY